MTDAQPLLLVIDEFGKNLEHFAVAGNEGDPFLLQELAEMTQGTGAAPLIIVTMQHLSFDEYVQDSSTARRKEWSKVQGRFQDIPYIETPAQSRRLIASAIQQHEVLREAASQWTLLHRDVLDAQGLRDIAEDAAAAIPLHPLALAVLPDLCSRYGQNERTLFSFLTSSEPSALPAYLAATRWAPGAPLPLVGIDLLYDYFLESSASMIGVADGASRWLEIETRIRDTAGLSPEQLRALKTIGLLNLVSTGGRIRASRPLVELALQMDGDHRAEVGEVLTSLIDAGLITYRAFSDEYRIWHGSDYDVRRVIDNARHEYEDAELADLLGQALTLEPLVAGRHSQRTGVLRVFGRHFIGEGQAAPIDPSWDGIVYYTTDLSINPQTAPAPTDGRPAVYVVPDEICAVRSAAVEAAALTSALKSAEAEGADWVAQRELVERASGAQQRLHLAIGETWNINAKWLLAGSKGQLNPRAGISALLSDVADTAYPDTPRVANEMIARRELTSQGAKARRFLTDALIAHPDEEAFEIEGYGPERAIYEAIFRSTGMHRLSGAGNWALHPPSDRTWKPAWTLMNSAFNGAVDSRLSLGEIGTQLTLPPVGLKNGIVPLLLIAGLLFRGDEIALYEHGSLVLSIDDAVAERLAKNLSHFSIKNTETRSGKRAAVIAKLVDRLGITTRSGGGTPTFLNVATALYRELRVLPPFVQKTRRHLSREAADVRDAFHHAAEPDVLLFETLPEIFGLGSFSGSSRAGSQAAAEFADHLAKAIRELRECYPALLTSVHRQLAEATSTSGDLPDVRRALVADATRLQGHVLEPRLKALVAALLRPLDDEAWLENVAMVVSEGQAPRVWTDDIAGRFALRITELGGALRRTSALLHERLASTVRQSYSSRRMTLTRPDGTESIELLSLTDSERAMVDQYFLPLIDEVAAGGISRATACRMLMARLAEEYESTGSAQTHALDREVQQHG
ncbi:hypothetical protein H7J11_29625 [Mycobacterium bourgelatii]|nr:hypothetical protein [Mycobacterium bourgelatii]